MCQELGVLVRGDSLPKYLWGYTARDSSGTVPPKSLCEGTRHERALGSEHAGRYTSRVHDLGIGGALGGENLHVSDQSLESTLTYFANGFEPAPGVERVIISQATNNWRSCAIIATKGCASQPKGCRI